MVIQVHNGLSTVRRLLYVQYQVPFLACIISFLYSSGSIFAELRRLWLSFPK